MKKNLCFIGAGNMATALIGGLITNGYPAEKLYAADPHSEQLSKLKTQFKIQTTTDNQTAIKNADIVILCVKPQSLKEVVLALAENLQQQKPLLISIAAMIPVPQIQEWVGAPISIIRCMPNTPALIRKGATGLFANPYVSEEQKKIAEEIMQAVGVTTWIANEKQMDVVGILSGSGPAYFFYLMEILQATAEKMGLDKETAKLLTLQTGVGATELASESIKDLKVLRQEVTSKGGITEKAFEILEQVNWEKIFLEAFTAACERSRQIAKNLKDN